MFDLIKIRLWKLRFAGNELLMDREKQGIRVYTNGKLSIFAFAKYHRQGLRLAGLAKNSSRPADCPLSGAFHASSTGLTCGFLGKPGKQTMPGSEPCMGKSLCTGALQIRSDI